MAWLWLLTTAVGYAQIQPVTPSRPQPYEATVAVDLRAQPQLNAPLLQRVAVGQRMQLLQMQGGWARVRLDRTQGWVRLSQIKPLQAPAAAAAGAGTRLASLFTADSITPVVTTGTRGLFKGWVTRSQPDAQAVQQMDGYAVGAQQAREFARSGGLQAHGVADDAGALP